VLRTLRSESYPSDPTPREAPTFTYAAIDERVIAAAEGLECIRLDSERSSNYTLIVWKERSAQWEMSQAL
jgi:hypothetical protein